MEPSNQQQNALLDAIAQTMIGAVMISIITWTVERIITLSKRTAEEIVDFLEKIGRIGI
jgi:hypothetical protein